MRRRPRLLVVDDDVELCESLVDALTDAGYEPVAACDGVGALRLSHDGRAPSLILLDLMMPDMNGWQFREQQLLDRQMKDIPVVVMTASRDLRRHPVQADAFLFKPFTLEDLLDQVQRVVAPIRSVARVRRLRTVARFARTSACGRLSVELVNRASPLRGESAIG